MSTEPILEVAGISKRYGETVALDRVSLTVEEGIFGLLGANGAGKSTLFKAVLDLVVPDEGEIRVAGLDVRRQSIEARRLLGYLPEELELYAHLTGRELLAFVAGLKGLDNPAERDELLAYYGMSEGADLLIGGYSLGMRKKIGLIAALMGEPRLVLLDEPLNGLDTENMRRLRLHLERLAAGGTVLVISSHVMSFVERVCAKVAILRRGRLAAMGTPAELRSAVEMPERPFEDVFLRLALGDAGSDQDPAARTVSMPS